MADDLLPVPPLVVPTPPETSGRYRVAMVINGIVHTVFNLDTTDAARYLSNPTFIQIPKTLYVDPGFLYTDGAFTPPPAVDAIPANPQNAAPVAPTPQEAPATPSVDSAPQA